MISTRCVPQGCVGSIFMYFSFYRNQDNFAHYSMRIIKNIFRRFIIVNVLHWVESERGRVKISIITDITNHFSIISDVITDSDRQNETAE